MTSPISRYDMSSMIYGVLYDRTGIVKEADPSEIGDWDQIPPYYQGCGCRCI